MATNANPLAAIQTELDNDLEKLGIPKDPSEANDTSKENDELKAQLAAFKTELDALKASRQEQQTRYVGPEGETARPAPQPQQTQTNQFQKRKISQEDWVKIAQDNPGKAVMEGINAELGLPEGSNPFSLIVPLAEKLKEHEAALKSNSEALRNQYVDSETKSFIEMTPGYERSPENAEVLDRLMKQYNLPLTAGNLQLVYTKAVTDGEIEPIKRQSRREATPQEREEPEDNDPLTPPRSKARVPSLRRGAPSDAQTADSIMQKLDRLPFDQAKAYYDRITSLNR